MSGLSRRSILLAGAALAVAPAGAATGVLAGPRAVTELAFWGGWTGPDGLAMQQLVARFNAEVRDIQVTLTLYNWDLLFRRWGAEFDGGSPPDIVGIHASEVGEYAAHGMLAEIARPAMRFGLNGSDFPRLLWTLCHAGEGLYAIPIDIHPLGLYINVEAAQHAGLDPRRPPASAPELLDWAVRLTDRPRRAWGYAAPAGDVECVRQWFSLLYQYGGRFMSADGTRCLADSAAGRAAFAFLRDSIAVQRVAMPREGAADADFLAGRLLMYAQGPWYIRGMLQQGIPLATAPMPRIGPRAAVWANSHVLGVVSSQDPARIAAAMRFTSWIHAHALDWAAAGQVPASNAARARLPELAIWPYLRPFAASIDRIVYQPQLITGSQVFAETLPTPLTRATRAVMLGRQTPAQAMRAMSDQIDQLVSAPSA